jgi:DNA-binding HxlR family transcriptional regulator
MSAMNQMSDEPVSMPAFCPAYHHAIELIGRRWSGVIIRAMIHGATRFSDISSAIPGISDRLISERLKELEAEGVVVRTVVPSTPVRVDYALTEKGRALGDVVAAVATWADAWCASPVDDRGSSG